MAVREDKQWWYFTFGCGQKYAGHYVRFYGTFTGAREKMIKQFGLEWAFQYNEDQWRKWADRCRDEGMGWMLETELGNSGT